MVEDPSNRDFEIKNLDRGSCYYVVVTAVNEKGEGYKALPMLVMTMEQDLTNDICTPYVWGSNDNSELGLSNELVLTNISFYQKFCMKHVIRQSLYERESVL
jgi:hypothetical protein